jgi:uncharacterized repeat protein (TIGR03803 family)
MKAYRPPRGWTSRTCLRIASAVFASVLILILLQAYAAQAQTYKVLHRFTDGRDGAYPESGLLRDANGDIYGMTYDGGSFNFGTVFRLDKAGKETVLHTFREDGSDGGCPYFGALLRDASGNLYGTASDGGDSNFGIIFKLDPHGKETVVHSFTGAPDGAYPFGGLIRDAAGNFYGTTREGGSGACSYGCGTVFKLDAAGNETVLYSFTGGSDGSYPYSTLVQDEAGNLYGTTSSGGGSACQEGSGCGTVFRLREGKLTVLHAFSAGMDGAIPFAGLVRDPAGNLYGTTNEGGGHNLGIVFKLDKNGQETVLHRFTGRPDGAVPWASLIRDAAGNLYGTTSKGGSGAGTVFKLDGQGNLSVLYEFPKRVDGRAPQASLIRDPAGNLYGTTTSGGSGHGVVFQLTP